MSHTPGPWHVSDSNEVLDEQSLLVAAEIMGERADIYRANARLIAAAPELLEALKDALAFLDRPDITTYEWYKLAPEHVGKFRRAIAKAEVSA